MHICFFPFFFWHIYDLSATDGGEQRTKGKLLVLFSNRTGGKGHHLKYREFHLNMSNNLYFRDEKRLSERLWPSLENLETCLHVVPGNLLYRRVLDLMVPALAVLWLFNHLGQCRVPLVKGFHCLKLPFCPLLTQKLIEWVVLQCLPGDWGEAEQPKVLQVLFPCFSKLYV